MYVNCHSLRFKKLVFSNLHWKSDASQITHHCKWQRWDMEATAYCLTQMHAIFSQPNIVAISNLQRFYPFSLFEFLGAICSFLCVVLCESSHRRRDVPLHIPWGLAKARSVWGDRRPGWGGGQSSEPWRSPSLRPYSVESWRSDPSHARIISAPAPISLPWNSWYPFLSAFQHPSSALQHRYIPRQP